MARLVPDLRTQPSGRQPQRGRQLLGVDHEVIWLLVPALLPVVALSVYPLLSGMYLGFTDARAGAMGTRTFNGLANYQRALADPYFWESLRAGLVWTFSVTILQFVTSLGLALLLDQRLPGRGVLRTLAILPWAVPPVVIGFMWQLVYHPNAGLLNTLLRGSGLTVSNVSWLASDFALAAVVIAAVWAGMPITTVVILAALQNVPRELHEAAAIDRAGALATFHVVTWPTILPAVAAITALDFISNFNAFGLVYVMTNGAPGGALRLPMLLAYEEAFTWGDYGYAAALGNLMVIVIAVVLAFYLRLTLPRDEPAR